jgi:hypothetical protein
VVARKGAALDPAATEIKGQNVNSISNAQRSSLRPEIISTPALIETRKPALAAPAFEVTFSQSRSHKRIFICHILNMIARAIRKI